MSGPSQSSTAPLLPNEGAESSTAVVQEDHPARIETQETTPNRGPPPSFLDGYESIGGVPALVIKPSAEDSKFTCQAFSPDGSLLATGESNGTIKLWKTANYTCAAEALGVFASRVESLAFLSGSNEQIVAVDILGNTQRFTIIDGRLQGSGTGRVDIPSTNAVEEKMTNDLSSRNDPYYDTDIRQQRIIRLSEDGRTAAEAIIAWAARGRRCYFTIWHAVHGYTNGSWRSLLSETYEFERNDVAFPQTIEMENHLNLAKGGNNLIALKSVLPRSPVLYCACGKESWDETMGDNETCVEWGGTGEYVLQWKLAGDDPDIAIHETARLDGTWNEPWRTDKLPISPELLEIDLQMPEGPLADGRKDVFVFELNKSQETKFIVWDANNRSVTAEINTSILKKNEARDSEQQPLEQDITFCASRDGKWVGCLSRRSGRCALASVESGTVTWMHDFADRQTTTEPLLFRRVMFSPSERHLLVFREDSIFAFAPSLLNSDLPGRMRTVPLRNLWNEDAQGTRASTQQQPHLDLRQATRTILLEGASLLLRRLPRDVLRRRLDFYLGDLPDSEKIIDASFSGDRQSLAIISGERDGTVKIKIGRVTWFRGFLAQHFEDTHFSSTNNPGDISFTPGRLFYYPVEDQEGIVMLPSECTHSIAFYNRIEQTWEIKKQREMKKLLYFCQTEDRSRMYLLDVDGVHIMDLASREIIDKITYQVVFTQLPDRENPESFYRDLLDTNPHLIADDGRSIAVPWTYEDEQRAKVTPEMEPTEWNALLTRAKEHHFSCCSVSGDGRCIASTTNDDQGLSIVISSTTGDMLYDIKTDWQLLERERMICSVTGSVFMAMIVNIEPEEDTPSDKIFRLYQCSIYSAEEFMPDYQRLKTQGPTDIAVRRLVQKHGISVLNGPPSSGMTIAQQAILDDEGKALEVIKESLQDQKMELAFDWMTEDGDAKNLLEEAMDRSSTNYVEHVIDLMRNKLVPLSNAAAALKECWKDLCDPRFEEILGKALFDNVFVFEACQFPVHVDFLNSTRRKLNAVHVGTADSFLDWKTTKNRRYLENEWRSKNLDVIQRMEQRGNKSESEASLSFVCIANAAKPGMDGIIRPLLMHRAPASFFQFNVVKWVIQHKWHSTWEKRVKWALLQHGVFLVCFTVYILIVGRCGDLSKADLWKQILSTALIAGIASYGWTQLWEEWNQLKNSAADSKELEESNWWYRLDLLDLLGRLGRLGLLGLLGRLGLLGLLGRLVQWCLSFAYYFSSAWNVLDLLSSSLMLVFIPTFHCVELFISGYQKPLSVFASIGIIMAYLKVWYHAQAFQSTGALVMIIDRIFRDAVYFLGLAFIVLCGFALALSFLLRHAASNHPDLISTDIESNLTNLANATELAEKSENVQESFGNIFKSLETLFFALLGDFERDVYHADDELGWWIVGMFVIYLITLVILLLNLLISSMSDTFDNVRNNEDKLLLMNRAKFIDACEAALSDSARQEIADEVKTYVHAVSDSENKCDEESDIWTGRLNAIEQSFRKNNRDLEKKMNEQESRMTAALTTTMNEQESRMTATMTTTMNEQESRMTAAMNEQKDQELRMTQAMEGELQAMRNELQAQEKRFAERTRGIESQIAAMNENMTRMNLLLERLPRQTGQTPGSQSALPSPEVD